MNNQTRKQEILRLKEELIGKYNTLMGSIMAISIIIFFFIDHRPVMYLCVAGTIYYFTFKYIFSSFSIGQIVRYYLIIAPLFVVYYTFYYLNYSVIGFCFLIPIPLAAYIFVGKKWIFATSLYVLLLIIVTYSLASTFSFNFTAKSYKRWLDILILGYNLAVVTLLIFYKGKIREQELLSTIEKREKIILPVTMEQEEISDADKTLFEKIENEMMTNLPYTNAEFNISMLSTTLKVNNNYISRAIRLQGYSNFNHYVNSHRIGYVKKLIDENDLNKITLMYIYTEAGFTSQSTFNRVFKQLEKITPSEYIQSIDKCITSE